jgi:hypothetical protein
VWCYPRQQDADLLVAIYRLADNRKEEEKEKA